MQLDAFTVILMTRNIVYDGRAARVTLNQDKIREIEEYYVKYEPDIANEYQIEECQNAAAHLDIVIDDPKRLRTQRMILQITMKQELQREQHFKWI